jgi:spore maturation protein CgeB
VGDVSVGADETCGIYWRSGVGLNVLAEWNVPAHNMRSFEIPATGTVMVATRTPEHIELFGDDGAVLVSNPAEGRAAVDELLHDEEARASVAARGLERVRPHTFAARMGELLAPWSLATPRSSAKLGTP